MDMTKIKGNVKWHFYWKTEHGSFLKPSSDYKILSLIFILRTNGSDLQFMKWPSIVICEHFKNMIFRGS